MRKMHENNMYVFDTRKTKEYTSKKYTLSEALYIANCDNVKVIYEDNFYVIIKKTAVEVMEGDKFNDPYINVNFTAYSDSFNNYLLMQFRKSGDNYTLSVEYYQ